MDFAKPVKAISLPQYVQSTSDRHLIELENQVQRLMEAHLAPKKPVQVNKITSSCEIYSGPHVTQYCMENPEQAFVDCASSSNNEVGEAHKKDCSPPIPLVTKQGLREHLLDDTSTRDTAEDSMAHINTVSIDQITKEELRIIILCKEDEFREEENVKPNATEYNDHEMTAKAEEKVDEESKDEFEEEIKE
nr:MAK10-like protein [Tanacetum cinerariifolium]